MNIPDKAVEAAANAMVSASPDLSGWGDLNQAEIDWYMRDARAALEAAAPFIAAQALKDHATAVVTHRVNATPTFFEGMKFAALLAMDRAFDLDQQP